MVAFARTRSPPQWANPGSLLEGGGDFGFGWGTGGGLLSGLPSGAREIVGSIYGAVRSGRARVVIAPTPLPALPSPRPADEEEPVVAHDWGHLAREIAGGLFGVSDPSSAFLYGTPAPFAGPLPASVPVPSPAAAPIPAAVAAAGCDMDGQPWGGATPPKGYKVVNYCGQAVLRKIRRRRRRRMLTVSDKNDIASIVSMVGKGQMAATLINRTSC